MASKKKPATPAISGDFDSLVSSIVYPHIWESLTPKSLAETGLGVIASLLPTAKSPIRETLTPESQIVETVSPQWFITQIGKEVGA